MARFLGLCRSVVLGVHSGRHLMMILRSAITDRARESAENRAVALWLGSDP